MRRLYSLLIYCAVPFAFAAVLWRGLRDRGYWQGLGERFGWGAARAAGAEHLAARGELGGDVGGRAAGARAARAVSAVSAGADHRDADRKGARRELVRRRRGRALPALRHAGCGRRVSWTASGRGWRIIMETELWPNLFARVRAPRRARWCSPARGCRRNRLSRYRRFGGLFRGIFSAEFAGRGADRRGCRALRGHRRAAAPGLGWSAISSSTWSWAPGSSTGDARCALRSAARGRCGSPAARMRARRSRCSRRTRSCAAGRPDALLLLVPRHPDRFDGGRGSAERAAACGSTRRSSGEARRTQTRRQVVLVDTVGELAALYASADVAFVGGSLVPIGGHNLLEPAALGLPVLTGPHHSNGKDIARLLLARARPCRCAMRASWRPSCARLLPIRRSASESEPSGGTSSSRIAAASRGCSNSSNRWLPAPAPVAAAAAAYP